jgi:hypothetical protein
VDLLVLFVIRVPQNLLPSNLYTFGSKESDVLRGLPANAVLVPAQIVVLAFGVGFTGRSI